MQASGASVYNNIPLISPILIISRETCPQSYQIKGNWQYSDLLHLGDLIWEIHLHFLCREDDTIVIPPVDFNKHGIVKVDKDPYQIVFVADGKEGETLLIMPCLDIINIHKEF